MTREEKRIGLSKLYKKIGILVGAVIVFFILSWFGLNIVSNTMELATQKTGVLQVADNSTSYLALKNQLATFTVIKIILKVALGFVAGVGGVAIGSLISKAVILYRSKEKK